MAADKVFSFFLLSLATSGLVPLLWAASLPSAACLALITHGSHLIIWPLVISLITHTLPGAGGDCPDGGRKGAWLLKWRRPPGKLYEGAKVLWPKVSETGKTGTWPFSAMGSFVSFRGSPAF